MPRLSKIGAAALGAFGWTGLSSVSASYLQVAGGGGGGGYNNGGGGGAGGYLAGTTSLSPLLSYTVTVGAGGSGGAAVSGTAGRGANGSNSSFGTLTASVGGGGGGCWDGASGGIAGASGGSGGGGGAVSAAGGAATSGQGFAGGTASTNSAGGGGGSSAVGANSPSSTTGGAGGAGTASSISGTSVTYAGGGGGSANTTQGAGGSGGGAAASFSGTAASGTANLGGGGGGVWGGTAGGNGGSGVVIISYLGAQQFGGGVVTSSGGYTIHTFNTSGTLAPLSSLTASYLIVAGGGSGGSGAGTAGNSAGGGGAGGLLSGSGLTIDTNSTYLVTIGAGGTAPTTNSVGADGSNSTFSMVSTAAVGGGGGGGGNASVAGRAGGSGGGATGGGGVGTGTSGQGNNGGTGSATGSYAGGGGGGSSATGGNATGSAAGTGGAGTTSSISGTSTTYAGGGGGGAYLSGGASGGSGGGGSGGTTANGSSGTSNTGGGGGGGGISASSTVYVGGNGGSGIVIISYAGATQSMAGGTVTISGGNVIHTFTSSGYLTPLKLVNNSLRFRSSASAYLSRSVTSTPTSNKWTFSAWVKRGKLSSAANSALVGAYRSSTSVTQIYFMDTDVLRVFSNGSGGNLDYQTTAVYRDPAAWYHIVVSIDNTTSTTAFAMYVNGVQVTSFGTSTNTLGQNNGIAFNLSGGTSYLANCVSTANVNFAYGDLYMAEVNCIDGQALTPNSFGTFNSYGVWQPITYGGSYGTNGFYLPFTNTTSTTTLGYDFSPQGNNWTPNNISLTTGSTYDSMTDVPTLTSATVANYATINALDYNSTYLTLSNANLRQTYAGFTAAAASRATMAIPTTGKFYWEVYLTTIGTNTTTIRAGICRQSTAISANSIDNSATSYMAITDGQKRNNSSDTTYGAAFSNGQILQVLYDATAGAIYFGQNNSFANGSGSYNQVFASATAAFTSLSGEFIPFFITYGGSDISVNFGQQPFTYTPPTGFLALNTYNL